MQTAHEFYEFPTIFIEPDEMETLEHPFGTRSGASAIQYATSVKRYVYPESVKKPENNIFMQCLSNQTAPGVPKEYYYIHLSPYQHETKHIIDEVSPLMKNPDEFEVGAIYTFILASIGVRQTQETHGSHPVFTPCTDKALYVAKANNIFEHGTKHQQIFFRMCQMEERTLTECAKSHKKGGRQGNPCFALFSSGEIRCTGPNSLVFNFFSGTYKMKSHVTSKQKVTHNETAVITSIINSIAPSYRVGHMDKPFITLSETPVTESELQRLEQHEIPVLRFGSGYECQAFYRELRIRSQGKWLSNDELRRVAREIREKLASASASASGSASGSSHSWKDTVQRWIPPGLPFSKWHGGKKRTAGKRKSSTKKRNHTRRS